MVYFFNYPEEQELYMALFLIGIALLVIITVLVRLVLLY
jgi:CHASE1-domain containing sensor protein